MSQLDQIDRFCDGLKAETRQEVSYRRCSTLSQAIEQAQAYERTHFDGAPGSTRARSVHSDLRAEGDGPTPMEIGTVDTRQVSMDTCRRLGLCFYCKRKDHSVNRCPIRQPRPFCSAGGKPNRKDVRAAVVQVEEEGLCSGKPAVEADTTEVEHPACYPVDVSTVNVNVNAPARESATTSLCIQNASVDGQAVRLLIDSGATHNIIKPGVVMSHKTPRMVQVRGFDGHLSPPTATADVTATVEFDGQSFPSVRFMEWPISTIMTEFWGKNGYPICIETFQQRLASGEYVEIFQMRITPTRQRPIDGRVQSLVVRFADVFPDQLPNELPPPRAIEHEITLRRDARPHPRAAFRLSLVEQEALQQFVDSMVERNWVQDPETGKAPTRAEWIRSGDPDAPVRWVIDYRHLNSQTEAPKIPLPRIDDLFYKMEGARYFSTIDLASGYHQMRMSPSSRRLTAFRASQDEYEWLVAPMGLAGMPGTWTRLMLSIFGGAKFGSFVVVYLDDICIFSRTIELHFKHLDAVLMELRKNRLYARTEKCVFMCSEVAFLGHVISAQGLQVDPRKVEAVTAWVAPTNRRELQRFLGLVGYYRRLIVDFATLLAPLSDLLKDEVPWRWDQAQEYAFYTVKAALTQAPIPQLPNFTIPFVVTTDASGVVVGGVLSQMKDGADLPVAYFSKKLGPTERRWSAVEQELLAIKLCFETWRVYLIGSPFRLFTDNIACRYILAPSRKKLSAKLLRWLDYFSEFRFEVYHRAGAANVVADALSRTEQKPSNSPVTRDLAVLCGDYTFAAASRQRTQTKTRHSESQTSSVLFVRAVHAAYASDPALRDGWRLLSQGQTVKKFELNSAGLMQLKTRDSVKLVCLPRVKAVLLKVYHDFHDAAIAAHPGVLQTFLAIRQWYFWQHQYEDVREHVVTCEMCLRNKAGLRRQGLLRPIPAPSVAWEVITSDFLTQLPVSNGYDAIQVVVCKLTKRPCYIPTNKTADAATVAELMFCHCFRQYGFPRAILSDRDPKFTSEFWTALMKIIGVKVSMTVAYRAQSDGQSERQIRTLEDSLRCVTSHYGADWFYKLPLVEFAHATLASASTGYSPFQLDTGRLPRQPPVPPASLTSTGSLFWAERHLIIQHAQDNLRRAQERQKKYYDKGRSVVEYKVDEWVLLDASHLTKRHVVEGDVENKLLPRYIGPFRICKKLSDTTFELQFPATMARLHSVFNIERFKKSSGTPAHLIGRKIYRAADFLFDEAGQRVHIVNKLVKQSFDLLVR